MTDRTKDPNEGIRVKPQGKVEGHMIKQGRATPQNQEDAEGHVLKGGRASKEPAPGDAGEGEVEGHEWRPGRVPAPSD